MIKVIGFDIDGCLQQWADYAVDKFYKMYKQTTGKRYGGRIDFTQYYVGNMFPDNDHPEIIESINQVSWIDYMETVEFEPFVKELFDFLHRKGIKIHIVTSRCDENPERMERVIEITKRRFFEARIHVDEFHIGNIDKDQIVRACGIELMIEDSPDNILQLSELIPVFKIPRPYNDLVRGSNIYTCNTLHPKTFWALLTYMDDHRNYLGLKEDLSDKENLDIFFVGVRCYVNARKLRQPGVIFMVPLSGKNMTSMIDRWESYLHGAYLIDLNMIDDSISKIEDAKIRSIIQKHNPEHKDIAYKSEIGADIYSIRSAIISDIIQYAIGRKERTIIFGAQIMQLERDILSKYKDHPFIFPEVTDAQKEIIMKSIYKKDYNIALLMEDLDEISLTTRKFNVIAGTDPDHLKGYMNREFFSSDGIDIVRLLTGEKPINPENLASNINMDTWLLADCHLKGDDQVKTNMIIDHINTYIKPNETLLFLGDFDGKKGASKEVIADFVSRIRCQNIYTLVGNNDGYKLYEYEQMGFRGITDIAEVPGEPDSKIILSHCPVAVERGDINIHGHLHGGRVYWNMDPRNHYDIYTEDFIPIRIRDCIEILNRGWYRAKGIHMSYT